MNTLISIIVPVYKTEPYLQKCLQSIVNQTYRTLEIILVDDGSPDRCPQICDEWAKKDSRISVIHQENSGLGKARNSGIEKAKGSYLAFVDSDDEIEPDMYEKLLAAAESCKADICYCGCKDVSSKGVVAGTPPLKFSYKGDEIRTEFIPQVLGTLPSDRHTVFCGVSSTSALYHAALLQKAGIRFLSERSDNISEDLDFNLKTCCHAEIIQIIPDTPYLYIKREINSLTSSYRSDRFEMVKKLYRQLMSFAESQRIAPVCQQRIETTFLNGMIGVIKTLVAAKKAKIFTGDLHEEMNQICRDPMVSSVLKDYPIFQLPWKQKVLWYTVKWHWSSIAILITKIRMKSN